jgi:subtilisin family serine protease
MGRQRYFSWLIGLALIVGVGRNGISPYRRDYAPGVVLVGFRDTISATEQQAGLDVIAAIPGIDVAAVRVPAGQELVALETLQGDHRVAFAELDYAVHATGVITPNDPGWANQWGPAKIEAPVAWSVVTGTSDIVVAVVDTGIQLAHQDLVGNLWTNPGEAPDNGSDDDGNGKVDDFWGWHFYHKWAWDGEKYTYLPWEDNHVADDHGHGTHVAGIAGARINNGVGVAGMAGGSRLLTVKVLDQYGNGWYSDVAQGIVYAVDNGAQVINLSLGGTPSSETLQAAVDYARAHGVLVVAATGNDGGAVLYPAACEHVLSVAATDQSDSRPSFSNHGPQVDVAAPGVGIYSTWPWVGGYFTKSGTSMAAPHVSGLAALIRSARPDLAMAQVTRIITTTAADVNGGDLPGWDEYLGWGRIEAGQALSAAIRAGSLHLTASRPQLPVGETTIIIATAIFTDSTWVTFTASGGVVFPQVIALADGVAMTTLVAGPVAGMAVVTGTAGTTTGTLYVRLLPGPVVSATLAPASWKVAPGRSVAVTLTATDGFGNPPLDGTPINWTASGGTITPARSTFYDSVGRAVLIASSAYEAATITASLETGLVTTIIIDTSPSYQRYLPVILHGYGN